MRAVRYHTHGDAAVLEVEDVSSPSPAADEVLVEMRAASVNPVDVMIRAGEYGQVPLPTVPGGDGAGRVVAAGDDVGTVEEGDRVFVSGMDRAVGGTYAEYTAVPETKVAKLPADTGFEAGAAIANAGATAWTALEDVAGIQTGDRVLVHGGLVGSATLRSRSLRAAERT